MKTIISMSATAVNKVKIKTLQDKKRAVVAKFKADTVALNKKHKEAISKIEVALKAAGYKKPAPKKRLMPVKTNRPIMGTVTKVSAIQKAREQRAKLKAAD